MRRVVITGMGIVSSLGNSVGAALLLLFAAILDMTHGFGGIIPEQPIHNITDFASGLTLAILVLNALFLGGIFDKLREQKQKLHRR